MVKYNWAKIRDAYEIEGLAYSKITERFGVAKATISEKVKKGGWIKGRAEPIISSKMQNIKEKKEIEQRAEQVFGNRSIMVNKEVDRRIRIEELCNAGIEYNQALANRVLKQKGKDAELQEINLHSQITTRNKDGVLGKMPTTQVNIQNVNAVDKSSMNEQQLQEALKACGLPPMILDE